MYKVNVEQKELTELKLIKFSELGLKERFDIQEWVEKMPSILGEELLIIAKEYILPSGTRLDLLAIDRLANLVVIELKRDDSGCAVDWQANEAPRRKRRGIRCQNSQMRNSHTARFASPPSTAPRGGEFTHSD